MSLYDGLDEEEKDKTEQEIPGWSSSIKMLQSQLQLKNRFLTQTKISREPPQKKSSTIMLPPVVDLKSRREAEEHKASPHVPVQPQLRQPEPRVPVALVSESYNSIGDPPIETNTSSGSNIGVIDEYDPLYPNDYEKIIKEQKERKEKERDEERRREYEERRRRNNERYHERDENERNKERRPKRTTEEEEYEDKPKRGVGAAIAPPTSLIESEVRQSLSPSAFSGSSIGRGSSVALKIMAKYGFKEGQGLGKQEQGMSQALQVEKTSKRGGKIIHERDVPKPAELQFIAPAPIIENLAAPMSPNSSDSITEAMKNPSKVVLLRNMVGPGEVDDDLEPEVKDECSKYGDVYKCIIFEIPNSPDDEAIRIFVEFKRIESAIKAVVDLNGRYFGGRIVKAGFYNLDKFRRLDLGD
ncbi:Splicing factor 45 [Chamberlinius hualienensis]